VSGAPPSSPARFATSARPGSERAVTLAVPAIVTARKQQASADVPDMTPEEHQRRGAAADAMWRELARGATSKP
jgi:hypothetical protein